MNEKVSLLEQRLRDAQAEKEIAVDIVKDELAHEKACNIELTTMVGTALFEALNDAFE